jgi:hypothetical protein
VEHVIKVAKCVERFHKLPALLLDLGDTLGVEREERDNVVPLAVEDLAEGLERRAEVAHCNFLKPLRVFQGGGEVNASRSRDLPDRQIPSVTTFTSQSIRQIWQRHSDLRGQNVANCIGAIRSGDSLPVDLSSISDRTATAGTNLSEFSAFVMSLGLNAINHN